MNRTQFRCQPADLSETPSNSTQAPASAAVSCKAWPLSFCACTQTNLDAAVPASLKIAISPSPRRRPWCATPRSGPSPSTPASADLDETLLDAVHPAQRLLHPPRHQLFRALRPRVGGQILVLAGCVESSIGPDLDPVARLQPPQQAGIAYQKIRACIPATAGIPASRSLRASAGPRERLRPTARGVVCQPSPDSRAGYLLTIRLSSGRGGI
jgi:hypothetical protein